ncbi:MAG: hypothetical protein ABTR07_07285 [Candidatus Competibacter denitrificans]
MKRQWLIGTLLGVVVNAGQAAPFLVCDPYPATGPQPDAFLVTVGTAAPVTVPATKETDGGVILKWDLTGIGEGAKTVKVRAKSAWGESADSLPFAFIPGVPAPPGGIRIGSAAK